MTVTIIDDYQVMYSANTFLPRVWLMHSGKWIGQLIFHPDGSALPPDGMTAGQANLHYHLEDFENLVGLLKNEKTVYLLYVGSGAENGVMTSEELVGS